MRRRAAAAATALILSGCGAAAANDTDAGSWSDGGVDYCDMTLSFSPAQPEAPSVVIVTGGIQKVGLFGVESYAWSVTRAGAPIAFSPRNIDESEIEFNGDQPGPYRVTLSGSVGGAGCTDAIEIVNVIDPAAATQTYRLRFVPPRSHPAPPQDRIVQFPGGADFALGTIGLDNGVALAGTVASSGGQPLPGYLRVTLSGATGGLLSETFADSSGQFSLRMMPGSYDVLVVPSEASAPAPLALTSQSASALGSLQVPEGELITGTVVDGSGAPIAGATVSARVGGVPSTLAVTDIGGAFVMKARGGTAASITVTPPAGLGLPRLELDASANLLLSATEPLSIQYAPALTARALSVAVMASDGATPAPGARLTLIARDITGAGSVTPAGGGALAATGRLRLTTEADGAGLVAAVVPEAMYDAVIAPAGGAERVTALSIDLSAGAVAPASLVLDAAATITGVVQSSSGGAISGVRVTAVPTGLLANVAGAGASAVTGDNGAFAFQVVGGGTYDVVLDSADMRWARSRTALTAPDAGQSAGIGPIVMRRAIAVSGTVTIPGVAGGAGGVHVMVLCYECSGSAASAPVAEAVTGPSGGFALALPDPAEAP